MSELIKTEKLKQDVLSELVKRLLSGENLKEFFLGNEEVIKNITPFDVFSISFLQEEANLEPERIKEIAGKLMNLLHRSLKLYPWDKGKTLPLIKLLLEEGEAIRNKFSEFKDLIKNPEKYPKEEFVKYLLKFKELEKRFLKMQYLIFPKLEKKNINPKPLQIMWSLHDDAKAKLTILQEKFENDAPDLNQEIGKFFFLVYGILEKEELLVLPLASRVLDKDDWKDLYNEAAEIGFSFLEVKSEKKAEASIKSEDGNLLFASKTGGMTLAELLMVLNRLPVDITFVDENNRVKYFNDSPERIFPRTAAVIGRDVKNCHPPKSVHVVEEIISEFRKGNKDVAKFWFETRGRFLVVNYYALRNEKGEYKGVLEVSQDVTEIRKLEGERKLLHWE